MGFSVVSPPSSGTLFAEIAIAEAQAQEAGNEMEGLLPQEFEETQMLKELAQLGLLKGDQKQNCFVKEESSTLPQKLQDYLCEINRPPQNKSFDLKNSDRYLSLKESFIKIKEFKVLEPHSQHLENEEERQQPNTLFKTSTTAGQALEKGRAPQSAAQLKGSATLKQQHTQARTLENKVHQDFVSNLNLKSDSQNRKNETKNETKEEPRAQEKRIEREHQEPFTRTLDKNEEREQHHRKKEQDEEEGFAGGQQDSSQREPEEEERHMGKVEKIDEAYIQKFVNYAAEESILSEIFKMRISQFDVLILFIEILKLEIKGKEQEKIARQQEREFQIIHMQKMVDNYKSQSNWTMITSLGSGILSIVSGLCPIVGHIKGQEILQGLGTIFEGIRDMKKDQLFKSIGKLTSTMAEMQKNTGQIHNTFAEGNRTFDQHMSDLYRSDYEERNRTIDEIKDHWKGIENFLYQTLQMYHDAIRQLYNA